jgi:ATP-dependent HslUV protease ATP-binding subunit HslU
MTLSALTPRQIVEELDRYIVGQRAAKRAVAIALRNRWRRQQVAGPLRDEIAPKNIIMIGPTGVGKTEIARRLAKLVQAPFLKVEASKFTEVGYVGRDVDSIVRDLIEISVKLVKDEEREKVQARAHEHAEERLLDLLLPPPAQAAPARSPFGMGAGVAAPPATTTATVSSDAARETRDKLRELLRAGKLDDRTVEVDVTESPSSLVDVFGGQGLEEMVIHLKDMLPGAGRKSRRRKVRVPEALDLLAAEEASKLIDMERVVKDAISRAENSGIVFIDELDKVAGRAAASAQGPDVSRQGVQRDLLPIVEGSTVTTKYGPVRTDHVLFIAAGAFHVAKPSDLIPELQGRFPIRVELEPLKGDDFVRILTEPENALTKQYAALLQTEGIELTYTPGAVTEIARLAALVNERAENIGARRLHTVMERILDELSFEAPALGGQAITITEQYVKDRLADIAADEDLSKYIL